MRIKLNIVQHNEKPISLIIAATANDSIMVSLLYPRTRKKTAEAMVNESGV